MNNNWTKYVHEDPTTHPEKNKPLWYYFDFVGVHLGEYYGDWVFAGNSGFLRGDVTHWQYDTGQGKPDQPQEDKDSIQDIVDEVYGWLEGESDKIMDEFIDTKKSDLIQYHTGLGRSIRNTFKLWERKWEPEIIDGADHSPNHPDQLSMRIIEQVWERARKAYR